MMYTESNSEDTGTSPENVVGLRSERPVSKRYQTTSSAAFSRSFETQLLWLERLYVLDEKEEVLQFLRTYPFLVPLLRDVYSRIETYFPDSLVFLEVTTNPEHLDRDQVVGRIATRVPFDEAAEMLRRFDQGWWLDALQQAQGRLLITVTSPFEEELESLEQKYTVRDKTAIRQFLRKHPPLLQLLLDTYKEIKAYFPSSEIFLDMSIDPEVAGDNENLIGSIATTLPPDEAIEAFEKFYDNWWWQAAKKADGKIAFGLGG
jgi:hypothetical protein